MFLKVDAKIIQIRRPIWRRACWTELKFPIPDTQYPPPNTLYPIPYIPYPIPTTFSAHKLRARAMAMAWSLGHGLRLGDIALGLVPWPTSFPGYQLAAWAMAMALGLRPLPGPQAKPGLRPRHKPDCQKANGHKLGAMAQDIRYPGVRVGEACGPGVAP